MSSSSSSDRPRRRISNFILWTTIVVVPLIWDNHWLFGGVVVVRRRWSNHTTVTAYVSALDPFVPQITTNYWHSICISSTKNNQRSQRIQKRQRMTPFVIVATSAATTTTAAAAAAAGSDNHHCPPPPPPPPPEESLRHRWEDYQSRVIAQCILPLSEHRHKGSAGRITIIGGSALYTGAPYFAGMAALRIGADLVSVCTAQEAVVPLKCYSPDLMVQSVYDTLQFQEIEESSYLHHQEDTTGLLPQPMRAMLSDVTRHFQEKRIHCVVIGPGMGRHPVVLNVVARIITVARQRGMYIVLDADALYLLSLRRYRYLLQGYDRAVITPNAMEYQRLMNDDDDDDDYRKLDQNDDDENHEYDENVHHTGDPLDAVTIVQKGYIDTIWRNGQVQWKCGETGGMKRAGGIGDVLAGTIGTMVTWQSILVSDRAKEEEEKVVVVVVPVNDSVAATTDTTTTTTTSTNPIPAAIAEVDLPLACWTACCIVKRATKRAFDIKLRSMSAQDVLDHLGPTMEDMLQ
jgi:ATP-dependent NAD(P)H-hydrate dehydratase